MNNLSLIAVIVLCSLVYAPARAAGDAAAGATAYNARGCVGCHGPAGKQPLPTYPIVGGKPAEFIASELQKFKSGERASPVMGPMTASLNPTDIDNLATYLSAQ